MNPSAMASIRAEAVFVSDLQPSGCPTPAQIQDAVLYALHVHRIGGCAALVAQEYGEHPAEAVTRMRWAVAAVSSAYSRPGLSVDRTTYRRNPGAA
ncbi:hypothetical protein ACIBEF_32020 [Micromonospora sp. NPDC050795]|uniref:hypothetical protein n=1 Tax=Micromonospora sp. NPDC050795 TaxID=3364282 RepID=UPI0037B1ECB2